MINTKAKGSAAERELIKMFWNAGWAAFRAAGSGSTPLPCPDLIAGTHNRKLAIECKSTKDSKKYLTKKEVDELLEFSRRFGCEAWIGIRFDRNKWYFISTEDMKEGISTYGTNIKDLTNKGLLFEELIGKFEY